MDEITRRIIIELRVKLTVGEEARTYLHATDNVAAYDLSLQGWKYWMRFEKESNFRAKQLFAQAIELDPNYTVAMAGLGWAHISDARFWGKDRKESLQLAEQWARRALAIDDTVGAAYTALGRVYNLQRKYEQAIAAGKRALEVEPNNASAHASLALTILYAGKPEEALVLSKKAMRLSPYYGITKLFIAGMAHFYTGRYEEGIPLHQEGVRRSQGQASLACQRLLIASYMKLEREEEARAEAKKYLQADPTFSLEGFSSWLKPFFKDPAMVDPYLEALRKTGLPE